MRVGFPFSNYSSWCLIALHSSPNNDWVMGSQWQCGNSITTRKGWSSGQRNQVMTSQSHWARVSRRVDVIKPQGGKQRQFFFKASRHINHRPQGHCSYRAFCSEFIHIASLSALHHSVLTQGKDERCKPDPSPGQARPLTTGMAFMILLFSPLQQLRI